MQSGGSGFFHFGIEYKKRAVVTARFRGGSQRGRLDADIDMLSQTRFSEYLGDLLLAFGHFTDHGHLGLKDRWGLPIDRGSGNRC